MAVLGPKEAAAMIRPKVALHHTEPHEQHALLYLKQVATELGLDHTPEVITHVAGLLREHGLDIHTGHEYPKMVKREWDGAIIEAKDEAHEQAIIHEAPPAPPPAHPAPKPAPVHREAAPNHDHFAEQEPGAAAMYDDGEVDVAEDEPAPGGRRGPDLSQRPR